jgi:hypothetical protein
VEESATVTPTLSPRILELRAQALVLMWDPVIDVDMLDGKVGAMHDLGYQFWGELLAHNRALYLAWRNLMFERDPDAMSDITTRRTKRTMPGHFCYPGCTCPGRAEVTRLLAGVTEAGEVSYLGSIGDVPGH